jgi:hypothetical protein
MSTTEPIPLTDTQAEAIDAAQRDNFDPSKYLVSLNGSRGLYLEVKFRLLWLRTKHPDAVIETEAIRIEERDAIFRAKVSIPSGGSATGWGSESAGDFRDFIEKAETKAIGRALAALGFGTQFCNDHDDIAAGHGEGVSARTGQPRIADAPVERARYQQGDRVPVGMRIVDAPVDLAAGRGRRAAPQGRSFEARAEAAPENQRATERQIKFIYAISREAGLDEQELSTWTQELYGCEVGELNRRDASTLIEALQRRRNEIS